MPFFILFCRITDTGHLKRRLYLSTVHREVSATPLHARVPLTSLARNVVSLNTWMSGNIKLQPCYFHKVSLVLNVFNIASCLSYWSCVDILHWHSPVTKHNHIDYLLNAIVWVPCFDSGVTCALMWMHSPERCSREQCFCTWMALAFQPHARSDASSLWKQSLQSQTEVGCANRRNMTR